MKNILSLFALLFLINSYNQVQLSPSEIMSKYIDAVGGKEKLESVESIMMTGNFEIPQAPFKPSVTIKQQNPNKTSLEMSAPEMGTIMKQKFNGETGYMEQMGQNIPLNEDQIKSSKSKKGIFEELYYDLSQLQVDGILYPFKTEIINGMQTITIEFEEIKFNESFVENDFN